MHDRLARVTVLPLVLAAWLTAVAPAWANVPDWSQYPDAYEEYMKQQQRILWTVIGCVSFAVIAAIVLLTLLIVWIVKRSGRSTAAQPPGAPGQPPGAPSAEQTGPIAAPADATPPVQPPAASEGSEQPPAATP